MIWKLFALIAFSCNLASPVWNGTGNLLISFLEKSLDVIVSTVVDREHQY